jgi:hypothetical protein
MTPKKRALASIKATGTAPEAKPATLKSLEQRKHITHQGGDRWSLTKRGEAFLAGRLGGNLSHRPTGAAGAKGTGRSGKARRGFSPTRAGQRAQAKAEKEAAKARHQEEAKAYRRILPAYAVKVAPSDGSAITAEDVRYFREDGWNVAPAGTVPAKVGRALAGADRDRPAADETPFVWNPDPLGPRGKARAVVLHASAKLTAADVEGLRAAGWDVSAAPKALREHPAGKVERNPSHNPKTRAVKKARQWFGDDELVTEPKVLKGYKAPDCAVEIGTFVAIEYDSHKYDGKSRVYRHEFTKERRIFVSPDGSTIIVDPPFRVTKRGIEG